MDMERWRCLSAGERRRGRTLQLRWQPGEVEIRASERRYCTAASDRRARREREGTRGPGQQALGAG